MSRQYHYVGPAEIAARIGPPAEPIRSLTQLEQTLQKLSGSRDSRRVVTVTFVIDLAGHLRIADRRSEHVACAGGQAVLSAGELTFAGAADVLEIVQVTNQSTGYCPEPESWPQVAAALRQLTLPLPDNFAPAYHFRRCPACGQVNLVKDAWFVCAICEAELPQAWNLAEK